VRKIISTYFSLDPVTGILRIFTFLAVLCFCGLLFFVIVSYLIDRSTFVQRAPTAFTKGKIISVTDARSGDGYSCTTLVQFSPDHKQSIEISADGGDADEDKCNGYRGNVVDVAYHIANPHDARVMSPGGFSLGEWIFFICALLLDVALVWGAWKSIFFW